MPWLFEISLLNGYHNIISGAIRRGVGADVIHTELNRLGANIPRQFVRSFAREVRRQIGDEDAIRRNWGNRSIDRNVYAPVLESSRYDYYYTYEFQGVNSRTNKTETFSRTLGTFEELDFNQALAQLEQSLEDNPYELKGLISEPVLTGTQRRLGI